MRGTHPHPASPDTISPSPESAAWCTTFTGDRSSGGVVEGWTSLSPNLPVCGPSPEYSSSPYANTPVRLPEAYGNTFWGSTLDGFQCVELSDRWLAMAYGLNVVSGNGAEVAENYYSAYHSSHPQMRLFANKTADQWPQPGDVISFSNDGFQDTGHVAVVVNGGSVNSAGNGAVYIAQENIEGLSWADQKLTVSGWQVAGEGFSDVEWLQPGPASSSAGFEAAFQANTGNMYTWSSTSGAANTGQGMMKGTSPAITAVAGGYEEAFQANTGKLIVFGTAQKLNTGLAMYPGTSPAIIALGSGYEVTYENSAGNLAFYGSAKTGALGLGMMAGTSPSIASNGSSFEAVFQANTGNMYTWSSTSGAANTGQGMMKSTSPAITAVGSQYEEAFQANTSHLIVFGQVKSVNTGQGMMAGTSPSISGT